MISDDAERTMCTDLGVSASLAASDLDEAISEVEIYYVEGYLIFRRGHHGSYGRTLVAIANNVKTAVSLSDISMVTIFKDNLYASLATMSSLFCNEEEIELGWN